MNRLDIPLLVQKQREFFLSGETKAYSFRRSQLEQLLHLLLENEEEILHALHADLGKSPFEAYATEYGFTMSELRFTLKHLKKWMKPTHVRSPLVLFGSRSRIEHHPYGVALIIAPWNYPLQLALAPLIGAIAAGNCAIIKPSELAPHTSQLLGELINQHFPAEYLYVVEGEVEVAQALLRESFDYLFFTGSIPVGKIVMEAAAHHLTPVTLELGGKSPCIVCQDADLQKAARRIVWGKFLNAGQTCVAPDYLLVDTRIKEALIAEIGKVLREFYGEEPLKSEDYPKIIHDRHFQRLLSFCEDGRIRYGGTWDPAGLKLAPTIMDEVGWEAPIMQEEIFGPILPVLTYDQLDEVIGKLQRLDKPLALYLFTNDQAVERKMLQNIPSGGVAINDTVMHLSSPYLPFGGVGSSGLGDYHGYYSFLTFSQRRSVLKQTNRFDLSLKYPPYSTQKYAWLRRLFK